MGRDKSVRLKHGGPLNSRYVFAISLLLLVECVSAEPVAWIGGMREGGRRWRGKGDEVEEGGGGGGGIQCVRVWLPSGPLALSVCGNCTTCFSLGTKVDRLKHILLLFHGQNEKANSNSLGSHLSQGSTKHKSFS